MVAVFARHAEKSELLGGGERAHPTNERNKLENSVCGTFSDIQPVVQVRVFRDAVVLADCVCSQTHLHSIGGGQWNTRAGFAFFMRAEEALRSLPRVLPIFRRFYSLLEVNAVSLHRRCVVTTAAESSHLPSIATTTCDSVPQLA